ncbi:BRO family protein [Pseudomonas sp. GD04087]|uniref:BRO-N domain-containing protein n=1 Tax=Pseudomonas TaxID=286 RepID=UPI00244D29E3|nr:MULTISPECIES: BRO family protein [Pseudomonas]MCP1652500.1 prophage antirepressor-like protein [Pseudomonas nitroreducens]MCP1690010.1 prophage antirepressor-like protein [Pseudomonas nitroreducens]MDH0290136.1 BRO family protein [Pseudomonas sp. GD04087]MDH1046952.1 BRO family protein [Pseudomonas sp. GD03903]MDH1999959.1 BRO family protein [Pseudomonas sp. GD03691]
MNLSISPADDGLIPAYFVRHHRQLRALLIEQQVWFVVRDLSKLLNRPVEVQLIARLDHDQSRYEQLAGHPEPQLLVSESGLYALLLVYCYHPENRSLRQWLSNEVVPALRDTPNHDTRLPRRRMQQLLGEALPVMDWQGNLWVRWRDAVGLLENHLRT